VFQHSLPHDGARPRLASTPLRPSPYPPTLGADRTTAARHAEAAQRFFMTSARSPAKHAPDRRIWAGEGGRGSAYRLVPGGLTTRVACTVSAGRRWLRVLIAGSSRRSRDDRSVSVGSNELGGHCRSPRRHGPSDAHQRRPAPNTGQAGNHHQQHARTGLQHGPAAGWWRRPGPRPGRSTRPWAVRIPDRRPYRSHVELGGEIYICWPHAHVHLDATRAGWGTWCRWRSWPA
jgi:hypothetical protein